MTGRITAAVRGNVIAWLALFVALGGTSLAASRYVIHSTRQISPKVLKSLAASNRTLFDKLLATTTVARANLANSATVAANATNATHASSADTATSAAHATIADSAPYIDSLPAGKTLRGVWAARGAMKQYAVISLNDPTSAPTTFHFIAPAQTPPPECPGSLADPQAQPGNMCVFAGNLFEGKETFAEGIDPATATIGSAGREGVVLYFTNTTEGAAYGTWAVSGN